MDAAANFEDLREGPVAGGRRVQLEMFFSLPDFSDISLRDYQETMQRPFFSLSKRKRLEPIEYRSPDKTVTVNVSANPAYGMATIWDADIMIYLASHLNEMRQRGDNEIGRVIRIQPGDLLKRISWGTSGRAYERLVSALDRLQSTTIKTNIRSNSKHRETMFSWIDSYTHLVDEKSQRSLGMEIALSNWFFEGVMDERNILSISPQYFEITSGLGKWLYRTARKHAGGNGNEGFSIGFETLHQKSGSESSYPVFKSKLLELAAANSLPEIHLEVRENETPRPRLKMVLRKYHQQPQIVSSEPVLASKAIITEALIEDEPPVDLALTRQLIARAKFGLKNADNEPTADPYNPIYTRPTGDIRYGELEGPAKPRRSQTCTRANEVLDPETLAAILRDFPGWDLDVLMGNFDRYLNANPNELPHNYSKRFYGFMKGHHERFKHQLNL